MANKPPPRRRRRAWGFEKNDLDVLFELSPTLTTSRHMFATLVEEYDEAAAAPAPSPEPLPEE